MRQQPTLQVRHPWVCPQLPLEGIVCLQSLSWRSAGVSPSNIKRESNGLGFNILQATHGGACKHLFLQPLHALPRNTPVSLVLCIREKKSLRTLQRTKFRRRSFVLRCKKKVAVSEFKKIGERARRETGTQPSVGGSLRWTRAKDRAPRRVLWPSCELGMGMLSRGGSRQTLVRFLQTLGWLTLTAAGGALRHTSRMFAWISTECHPVLVAYSNISHRSADCRYPLAPASPRC